MTRATYFSIVLFTLPFLFFCQIANAQNIGGVVNIYTPVTAFYGCQNQFLTVESTQGFSLGDEVLIIQMQGETIDLSDTPNFGTIIGSGGAGQYELNRIKSISGNQIQLQFLPSNFYNTAGKVQLVRVPEYSNATVTSPLTCQAWDGNTGGVLILDVSGTLTLQHNLDVSAKGFRGGAVVDANAAPYGQLGYTYAPNPVVSGQKGEGIAIIPLDKSYGRGRAANGGGAGNSHNGGGGGGGNEGEGGFGGLEYYNVPDMPTPGTNGIGGGHPYWNQDKHLLLGGGGGAGHTNDEHGSSGGNGGGIIILKVNNLITNSNSLLANGETVISTGTERNDGQGGGGAGGTIFLQANQVNGDLNCELKGGKGGDCLFYVQSQIIGPGGGGGGGKFIISQLFANVASTTAGGDHGIANQNLANGSTKGKGGVRISGVKLIEGNLPAAIEISKTIKLCPNQTVQFGSQVYAAPDTVLLTFPGTGIECDTLATFHLIEAPQILVAQTISLCPNQTTTLGGQNYTAPTTLNLTLPGFGDACDTLATYTLVLKPQVSQNENVSLCPGQTINLGGQNYTAPSTVNLTLPGFGDACDTLATYNLTLKPQVTVTRNIPLCPGATTTLGGQNYTAPTTVNLTLPGFGDACDTLATYNLILKPQVAVTRTIPLCPGVTSTLGGQNYTAPATVNLTLPGLGADCDTLATYLLELLPQPTLNQIIEFCPGETIILGGINYTQPGTVVLHLPAITGCDTIATYTLKRITPAPSTVKILCPNNIIVTSVPGTGAVVVNYPNPQGTSDCPCPGLQLRLTAGLPSGSLFPPTSSQVCWQAADSCGQTASCCFSITVREELPCDVKTIGCMKYELLSITADAAKNRTYNIRVTNNCPNKMSYTAIQIPDGLTAMSPAENSIFTASGTGRKYLVRNPNYSPFYSIRFKSTTDSISGGASDIFRYTLPAQADPTYIHILSRLEPQVYYEAHLNTFNCPIGITPPGAGKPEVEDRLTNPISSGILLFPNPTSGLLFADLSEWAGQNLQLQVLDGRGQMVFLQSMVADTEAQSIDLPEYLSTGIYFLEILTRTGERRMTRFAIAR